VSFPDGERGGIPSREQALIGIDVAYSGNKRLIQQGGFDGSCGTLEPLLEIGTL
jgi:hypothetical protein